MKKNLLKILPFACLIFLLNINVIAVLSNSLLDKGELRESLEKNQVRLKFIILNRNQMNTEETYQELQFLKNRVEKMLEEVTPFSASMAQRIINIQVAIENAMKQ